MFNHSPDDKPWMTSLHSDCVRAVHGRFVRSRVYELEELCSANPFDHLTKLPAPERTLNFMHSFPSTGRLWTFACRSFIIQPFDSLDGKRSCRLVDSSLHFNMESQLLEDGGEVLNNKYGFCLLANKSGRDTRFDAALCATGIRGIECA